MSNATTAAFGGSRDSVDALPLMNSSRHRTDSADGVGVPDSSAPDADADADADDDANESGGVIGTSDDDDDSELCDPPHASLIPTATSKGALATCTPRVPSTSTIGDGSVR